MTGPVFITGAGGFLGAELVARIASDGVPLRLLLRNPDAAGPLPPSAEAVRGDLLEPQGYAAALAGVETIVHLAALTGKAPAAKFRRVNVEGTEQLLAACASAGVKNFLFVSSIAAGYPSQRFYPYAQSKQAAEASVARSGLAFTIVRPTIILGQKSPIWATVSKLAGLPVIPLPQGRVKVAIQPVDVGDVARGIAAILHAGRFEGETFDLGGKDAVSMRDFLAAIHREKTGRSPRFVPLPLALLQQVLALMEPLARRFMPATAGQLSLFGNDSTARENWLMEVLAPGMLALDAMISSLCADDKGGPACGPHAPRKETVASDSPPDEALRQRLTAECAAFSAYLAGQRADDGITRHYIAGLAARELLSGADAFDRFTLHLARRGGILLRLTDDYCGVFCRRGLLRRRLILLLAILEHASATHERFDHAPDSGKAAALLGLAANGLTALVSLALSAPLFLPVQLALHVAGHRRTS